MTLITLGTFSTSHWLAAMIKSRRKEEVCLLWSVQLNAALVEGAAGSFMSWFQRENFTISTDCSTLGLNLK